MFLFLKNQALGSIVRPQRQGRLVWLRRWRWFCLAAAGLFGFSGGEEWDVQPLPDEGSVIFAFIMGHDRLDWPVGGTHEAHLDDCWRR